MPYQLQVLLFTINTDRFYPTCSARLWPTPQTLGLAHYPTIDLAKAASERYRVAALIRNKKWVSIRPKSIIGVSSMWGCQMKDINEEMQRKFLENENSKYWLSYGPSCFFWEPDCILELLFFRNNALFGHFWGLLTPSTPFQASKVEQIDPLGLPRVRHLFDVEK